MLGFNYVALDNSLLLSNEWRMNTHYTDLDNNERSFRELCELITGFVLDIIIDKESMVDDYDDIFIICGICVLYLPFTKTLVFQSGDGTITHCENLKQWLV